MSDQPPASRAPLLHDLLVAVDGVSEATVERMAKAAGTIDPTLRSLLFGVLADPHDNTARGVLRDYLEERSTPPPDAPPTPVRGPDNDSRWRRIDYLLKGEIAAKLGSIRYPRGDPSSKSQLRMYLSGMLRERAGIPWDVPDGYDLGPALTAVRRADLGTMIVERYLKCQVGSFSWHYIRDTAAISGITLPPRGSRL